MDPFDRFLGLDANSLPEEAAAALSHDWAQDGEDADDADDHVAADEE